MTNPSEFALLVCVWSLFGASVTGTASGEDAAPIVLATATTPCASPSGLRCAAGVAPHGSVTVGRVAPTVLDAGSATGVSGWVPLPAGCVGSGPRGVSAAAPAATVPIRPAPVRVLRPVVPVRPPPPGGYILGRGLIGQPKLYVPGQPVRNVLRYLSL